MYIYILCIYGYNQQGGPSCSACDAGSCHVICTAKLTFIKFTMDLFEATFRGTLGISIAYGNHMIIWLM